MEINLISWNISHLLCLFFHDNKQAAGCSPGLFLLPARGEVNSVRCYDHGNNPEPTQSPWLFKMEEWCGKNGDLVGYCWISILAQLFLCQGTSDLCLTFYPHLSTIFNHSCAVLLLKLPQWSSRDQQESLQGSGRMWWECRQFKCQGAPRALSHDWQDSRIP